jgi:protein TonB
LRTILTAAVLAAAVIAAPAAQSDQTYKPGNGVTNPQLKKEVKPTYTEGAMRRRVQGNVEMSVVVLRDGTVSDDVKVTKSLDDELDQQAIVAVKQWLFNPGTKDGQPVNVRVTIEMTFTLRK